MDIGYASYTKDMAHKKRKKHFNCSHIVPSLSGNLTIKKAHFLSKLCNKQRFVDLLRAFLEHCGFTCLAATDDHADVLICQTAVDMYHKHQNITVVGDDTDLLVILVDMLKDNNHLQKLFMSTKTIKHVYMIYSP